MSNQQNFLKTSHWYPIEQACKILNLTEKTIKNKCYMGKLPYKVEIGNNNKTNYFIKIDLQNPYSSISNELQNKNYSEMPNWAKAKANKYNAILKNCGNLKGAKLQKFVEEWNQNNPDNQTSYNSILRIRKKYKEQGLKGLIAKYGTNNSKSTVLDEYFDYFKTLYLVEGSPSLQTCWDQTFGYARLNHNVEKSDFPSVMAFKRRLLKEIPNPSIYLARNGESAWNRKYGNFIDRDYSNILCNQVWVSDHAQIDVACFDNNGKVVFPWVTAWRDYKSGKWLGWILQTNHPNSDFIFQAFYYAVENYGLPRDVIIDNGKDYRSKDFAGGRKVININTDVGITTSMLEELNVDVHFALPYNAQTKPIERDFLKVKGMLSKHSVGYRGGNVVERPEKLNDEIKFKKLLQFDEFKTIFDDFIINIFNKCPSEGKNLNGKSPDALFIEECKIKILPSKDALKLFCMRTSKNYTIKRNGIRDNQLGITYWSDWMIAYTGTKVYLRRDIKNYKEAWVFRADNEEFIGKTIAVQAVAALYANEVSKEEFKIAMENKKRNLAITKSYIKTNREISLQEKCENYKAAYASVEKEFNPKVTIMANTNMDRAIRKNQEMEEFGHYDLSQFIDETTEDEPIYLYETDKLIAEELKGIANGS